jgi:Bacterial Ig-like domain (group 2)
MSGVLPSTRRSYLVLVSLCLAAVVACGSDRPSPVAPAAPTPPTTSAVQVRATGDASGSLEAGQTQQLVATATQSTGSTSDVTQQATWQSSAPGVATVSSTGLVSAVAEGQAEISATFQSVRGTIGFGVRPVRCALSISPATVTFGPFGGAGSVQVLVSAPSCRWNARSDAPWLPLTFEPAAAGSGTFGYTAPANSTTAPRTARILVTTSTGESAAHAITVDRTTGCSYVTQPEEAVFTASGGTGQFNVITTPNDCRWNLVNGMASLGVHVTAGFSGTGAGLVRYSVQAHTRDVDADGYIEIAGLSGANPNGRHHIVLPKR